MTEIINIGMNHETAPVELRECLVTEPGNTFNALASMRDLPFIKESFFLSTCNRVESMAITESIDQAKKFMVSLFSEMANVPESRLLSSLYILTNMDAVKHIFMVASGLDSMVLGEPQILGQIKEAYNESTRQKTAGVILNRMMHRAFHTAKRVRTETGVNEAAVSISYAAVELAKKIFHVLDGKKALLVGAGEMAELAARHLLSNGVSSMVVANRTFQRGIELAESFDAHPVSFDEIEKQLEEVDIVVSSTASPEYVITRDQVKRCLKKRRNRPLFLIDIAVPRDVQPEVNKLDNVFVYDIDDLKDVIRLNMEQRRQEAVKAERLVQEEVAKFEKWLKTLDVVPTIVSLKEKAESIVQAELKKSKTGLVGLTPAQTEVIHRLARSIAEKVLVDPISFLRRKADRPTANNYIDVARKLFNLD